MASIKINKTCSFCNKEFQRSKSDVEKTEKKIGKIFCSIHCSKQNLIQEEIKKGFSENKNCTKCNLEKPRTIEYFSPHKKTLDKLDSWCKSCRSVYRNEFRRGLYRSMISDKDLVELLKTEKCEICGSIEKLVVDHDHKDNFVRGMLCNHCNRGLGHFRDNPLFLQNAKDYLLKFNVIKNYTQELYNSEN
jgi:hypothetical protein